MEQYVVDVMSTKPVLVDATSSTSHALSWAGTHQVHYLIVARDGSVLGVVCLCDLERARGRARVSTCMHTPAVIVDTQQTVRAAVTVMERHRVGCLPVVDWLSDLLQGVITRHDLRGRAPDSAFLNRRCASCGHSHGLHYLGDLELFFCRGCLAAASAPDSPEDDLYFTLGGGD